MKTFNKHTLKNKRNSADNLADLVAKEIFDSHKENLKELLSWLNASTDALPMATEKVIQNYLESVELPLWADKDKMQTSAYFYKKNEKAILFLLGTLSLPYCYAASKGVKVLFRSQRLHNDALKRLTETAIFVKRANEFQENNIQEWKNNILKIRLLHAFARLLVGAQDWNEQDWGKPINQEDMAGTNLSFSYIVLKGMRKMNITYTHKEADSFLHLWNVIGSLMGVDEDLLPDTLQEAYWLDKMIAETEFEESEEGKILTKSLMQVYESQSPTKPVAFYFIAQMRFLLGERIANMLKIPAINTIIPMPIINSLGVENWLLPAPEYFMK
ncbi:MAG: oxygenase MpaB family protein [Thermonemataceae bacterium]|nr:oxygenase MpaB family protein [Thermonemataceae bacterium]